MIKIKSTEEYISEHEDEVLLKFLHRKEILRSGDMSFYEDKIASNFSVYASNDDIASLDISTLYRILEKARMNGWSEVNSSSTKDFLMKVLDERGRPASILFKFADISAFDDETLTRLLTKHSQSFDFEFITPAVLNAYLRQKEEHKKQEEESAKKYEAVAKELQAQKDINKEMSATIEKEIQKHKKQEEESAKKYARVDRELQEQKSINDGVNKQLLKSQSENEQLRAQQQSEKREREELCRELDHLKKQVKSMRAGKKDQDDEHLEDKFDGSISICKYGENVIINSNANKHQVDSLVKYLIKETDKHQKRRKSIENVQEIVFMKRKQATAKDNDNDSTQAEEDIFISHDMINVMHETGGLRSMELQNELKQLPCIYFDLRYPTPNFESIYREIIQIKQHLGNQMKISIFYEGRKDTDQRFRNNKEISHLRLGKSVRNIISSGKDGSFEGCSSLTSVSIPSSVTSIGDYAFYGCSSLTSVSIPSSVTSIGDCAFFGCSSLTSVSIPSSVTSIGSYAFFGCSSLTSVSIPSSVTSIGWGAFEGCSSLTSVSIPSSLKIGSAGFSQKVKINII